MVERPPDGRTRRRGAGAAERQLRVLRWGLVPVVGEGPVDRQPDDQRADGDRRREAGVQAGLREAPLPAARRRLLRVVPHRAADQGRQAPQAAVLHPPRRTTARWPWPGSTRSGATRPAPTTTPSGSAGPAPSSPPRPRTPSATSTTGCRSWSSATAGRSGWTRPVRAGPPAGPAGAGRPRATWRPTRSSTAGQQRAQQRPGAARAAPARRVPGMSRAEAVSTERRVATPHGEARLVTDRARHPVATLLLSHGAGDGIDTRDLEALARHLPRNGITVVRLEQPWKVAGRRIATAPATLDEALVAAADQLRVRTPLVVGGRSAGARSAARCAQSARARCGCLALAFPLHPPGRPEKSRLRRAARGPGADAGDPGRARHDGPARGVPRRRRPRRRTRRRPRRSRCRRAAPSRRTRRWRSSSRPTLEWIVREVGPANRRPEWVAGLRCSALVLAIARTAPPYAGRA